MSQTQQVSPSSPDSQEEHEVFVGPPGHTPHPSPVFVLPPPVPQVEVISLIFDEVPPAPVRQVEVVNLINDEVEFVPLPAPAPVAAPVPQTPPRASLCPYPPPEAPRRASLCPYSPIDLTEPVSCGKRLFAEPEQPEGFKCPICLESETLTAEDLTFLCCSHYLCNSCYARLPGSFCPLCRKSFRPDEDEEEEEEEEDEFY
jgi:hypothetical protein